MDIVSVYNQPEVLWKRGVTSKKTLILYFFLLLNPIFHIFVTNRPVIKFLMKTEFQFPENLIL